MTHRPRRWMALLLTGALLLPMVALSQSTDPDDPELVYFYGGKLDISAAFASKLISGPGVQGVTTSSASAARPDPFVVFGNPANMRHTRDKPSFGIVLTPRIGFGLPAGMQDGVDEAMDEFITDFQQPNPNEIAYPEAGGTMTRSPESLSSFSMIVPADKWRIGFGYTRPFYLDADITLGGFSQRINQPEDDPAEEIAFAIQTRMALELFARADKWTVGASREFGPWSAGFSVSRTYIELGITGGYDVDGIMTRGTQQYAFNDPSDPWYNQFAGIWRGSYTGSMYTYRFGGTYQIGGKEETSWRLGLDLAINSGNTLRGDMTMSVDEFLAMELQPDDDEEAFDVNRIEDVTEITRTYNNQYYTGDELNFNVPSSLTIGIAKPGGWRPNFNFTMYFGGDFGYEIDVTEKRVEWEDYRTTTYGRGLTPQYAFYLGINPGWFFMGLGATMATDYSTGYQDDNDVPIVDETTVPIPRFDMGVTFHLSEHLRYEMLIVGLPEDALRIGLAYEF